MSIAVVILAAGQGTRMKSNRSKVLHSVGGKPMVMRAVESARKLTDQLPVVVVGRDADSVRETVGGQARFVEQAVQLGTGHAVMQVTETLRGQTDLVVVFYADMPLLRPETLQSLIDAQQSNSGAMTLLTVRADDPRGFGRILRGSDDNVIGIVEEAECTPEQLLINELNAGVYCFKADWLWDNLTKLTPKSKNELYLTDTVQLAYEQQLPVIGVVSDDMDEVIGVNNRVHLNDAETALRRRINRKWMLEGVTIIDPLTTYIEEDAVISRDTIIYPNTYIQGKSQIGEECVLGPNTIIRDSVIGAHCVIFSSVIEEATTENHVDIGPFSHLRKGAHLAEHVHMGNFGEVKNSRLGAHSRMGHFSYLGDAEVGEDVNIGAGTITANFDGKNKHKTIIGDHAFIGSDTMLVAPVKVENNARTAAGSVVTKDVPTGHVAVGVPARPRPIKDSVQAGENGNQGETAS